MCDCKESNNSNNYPLLTATTGIASISTSNNNLDGTGAVTVLQTSGSGKGGTIIKSVKIMATGPVTTGMVRLFMSDGTHNTLYKEIPISNTPVLASTPMPLPMLQMFEILLKGDIKMPSGYRLLASTQNSESFNVIAEGVNWAYPTTVPGSTCCSFMQEIGNMGLGTVSVANTNLDGSGTITTIFTAATGKNGAIIKTIVIKALQSTNEGIIRLFIGNGTAKFLFKEIYIPQTVQSGFQPSFKYVMDEPYYLQAGYTIGVSTQIAQSFAVTIEGTDFVYGIS